MICLISIIIPTFHRKNSLLRLLKSLVQEIRTRSEVIVVEQAENNEGLIKKFAREHKINVRYIFLHAPSITHAVNIGIKAAKGEYVLLLDDDVVVKVGLIENHLKNFKDPMVAATVGRAVAEGQPVELDRQETGRINWLAQFSDGYSSTFRQVVDTVIGCNTCWRKVVLRQLGGVDEQFTGNSLRFESDLSLRAKKAGYKIIFEPTAEVLHMRAETGGTRKTEGRMQWYFHFLSNETYFFLKHRPTVLLPLFLLTKTEWVLRCMFGFGREVSVRSMVTPFAGIIDGIRKYRRYLYENRS